MSRERIEIRTRAGVCPAHVFHPDGPGPWPGVVFYMDGLGIRPALLDMAERLARGGYLVLLPDLYYRAGAYAPLDPKAVFASGNPMQAIGHLYSSTNNQLAAEDTEGFLAYLDSRSDLAGPRLGCTGYCMGGGIALMAAATYPERFAAAASFHGGNLASDSPLSPHRVAARIQACVYVAGADEDNSYPPAMAARLEQALGDGAVPHRCEIYAGALHGWTMTDFPVYDEAAAERHWRELLALFERTLK